MTGEKAEKERNGEVGKEEKRGRKRKSKQFKVGITESGMKALNDYLEQVNRSSRRRINVPEVLEFAVQKLSDKDIRKIQELAYTPDDKMELMLEEYNQRNPEKPLTMEQLKASMVEVFDKQVMSKVPKYTKTNGQEELGLK